MPVGRPELGKIKESVSRTSKKIARAGLRYGGPGSAVIGAAATGLLGPELQVNQTNISSEASRNSITIGFNRVLAQEESALVSREEKALTYMRQKIRADKLPQDAEIKWSTDVSPQRTRVSGELTIQDEDGRKTLISVHHMERPDGSFLQRMVSVRLFNTPNPIQSLNPDKVQETIASYVNLDGIGGDWTFYQGSKTVPSRTERTLREGDVLYSEGAILFGQNDNSIGNIQIQIAEHTKGTLEYNQGTGFATILAQ